MRLAGLYLSMAAGSLVHLAGDLDEAAKLIERELLDHLDSPPPT